MGCEMPAHEPAEVTLLLEAWSRGDAQAAEKLMPLVFEELRSLAARYLEKERPDHTLQPTALVHEAYIRLVGQKEGGWKNRGHFFAVAAKMMRRILVDHARSRHSDKRGGRAARVPIEVVEDLPVERSPDLLALDQALDGLAAFDPQKASIVELRFFVGLDLREIARAMGCSTATVTRHWLAARAWLYREMKAGETA
jgi:RNA polymerase sigma factor (TIGR02999 family)